MLLLNRRYDREAPNRDAKKNLIVCEGAKTEYSYFSFFKEMDSRVNIQVYKIKDGDDHSPLGLFHIAQQKINADEDWNINSSNGDEIWIVFDVDPDKYNSRQKTFEELYSKCEKAEFKLALSNPCFEVWLFYHFKLDDSFKMNNCKALKKILREYLKTGFDPRKHPVLIQTAIENAKKALKQNNFKVESGFTEVYKLGESIYNIVGEKVDYLRSIMVI